MDGSPISHCVFCQMVADHLVSLASSSALDWPILVNSTNAMGGALSTSGWIVAGII
jgi:hypothetical protein